MLLVVHGTNDLGLSRPAPPYPAALSRAGIAHGFCDAETPLCAFSLAESYDGLFLTGGGDSDPLLYGQSRGAKLSPVSKMRDENEVSLNQLQEDEEEGFEDEEEEQCPDDFDDDLGDIDDYADDDEEEDEDEEEEDDELDDLD